MLPADDRALGRGLARFDASNETRALMTAEAYALGARGEVGPGLLWFDAPPDLSRSAFALVGGEVVAAGPAKGPVSPIIEDAREVHVARGPWKVHHNPLDLLAQLGWPARYQPPGLPGFQLFATTAGWWLVRTPGWLAWTEPALVYRTSTSLPSRLARAVVNLVARPGERVLDPVCGTGVLLIEAARCGCAVTGGDTSKKAAGSARANLRALGFPPSVSVTDALLPRADAPFDAVVGDLPYGLRLQPVDLTPFARALPALGRRWAIVAHLDLSDPLRAAGYAPRAVIPVPKSSFTRYVHVGGRPMGPA